ncbi:hypothetical protein DCS_01456 [Drechmeria coniospora]|uniref:Pyridoxal-dependent decarboxylase n=1 Tax=Drechmeria coniospora TaxID=98403 RepID=A0A151GT76_DRECN|nr:hypothetical protein DCS_01456 [Drechmeria coniospora]KYK60319.1 hypothetical protein DCS_01456 [Drechmeria coniospora]ODA80259.1 hypothetical protein RJ55_03217 [Drechmeria coniospora]
MSDDTLEPTAIARRLERRLKSDDAVDSPTLPTLSAIQSAEAALAAVTDRHLSHGHESLPAAAVVAHILDDIVPALTGQARTSRYYGFVTGGVLPVAEWADNVVSRLDQNVQVHLPTQSVATAVEDASLRMLAALLRLRPADWPGRTLTTGATASNVLGLACGREAVLESRLRRAGVAAGVAELGLLSACRRAAVDEIQVLTSVGHSSLAKAAAVVGIGRACVKDLGLGGKEPWRLDIDRLERELQRPGVASIIAISAGDVNTGRYALEGTAEWSRVRALADKYASWIHVDGAFGIFTRLLGLVDEYSPLHRRLQGIELADSITVDGHKILNLPYDCGMFYTRSPAILSSVFANPNAAYLSSGPGSSIPSPLHIGLENSRRFRALPLYAAILNEGKAGFGRLVAAMVDISRRIAAFLRDSTHYELLPDGSASLDDIFMIVLFRAKDDMLNDVLVDRINETRQMYVSETSWGGSKAVRIAVSNWKVDVHRDFEIVAGILNAVAAGEKFDVGRR